jgi:hypothetical protein
LSKLAQAIVPRPVALTVGVPEDVRVVYERERGR